MAPEETLLFISRWVVKRGRSLLLIVVGLTSCLLLAAWFNPRQSTRVERDWEERRILHERDLVALAAQAKGDPAQGRLDLTFNRLGFVLPPEALDPSASRGYGPWLPEPIKGYDGRDVRIRGYVLPTRMEEGRVAEGLLLPNRMVCCYGMAPRFCDFIVARFPRPVEATWQDHLLFFEGTLRVRDVFDRGTWIALYSMDDAQAMR